MKKILVVNAGSSTIKWKLFSKENLHVIAEGLADRIFVDGAIETKFNGAKYGRKVQLNSHMDAANEIARDLEELSIIENKSDIEYIGHRVVQGGTIFADTVKIDEKEIKEIEELIPLAPLHNPGSVQAIKAMKQIFPNAINTATFDTAFHTSIPRVNYTYPINSDFAKKYGIRKYGMHGSSHKYITKQVEQLFKRERVSFVNLHIGNGVSLCAVKDSQSYDTSMGLTPLAGVMMGTRSGDIDPSIHAYACKEANISIDEFNTLLNKESGLKGVSKISSDMRDVKKAMLEGNQVAQFTFDLYTQKLADYTINYLNKVEKPEAIIFTAGVGENCPYTRQAIIDKLHLLHIKIDNERNIGHIGDVQKISTDDSQVPVYVIRTNEELLIAQEALAIK